MNRRTFAGRVLGALAAALAFPWRKAEAQPNVAFGTPEHGAATRANTVEDFEWLGRSFEQLDAAPLGARLSDPLLPDVVWRKVDAMRWERE